MKFDFDFLSKSPFITLSGYLLGIISFVFAIYTYEATKQSGQLFYTWDSRLIYAPVIPSMLPEQILAAQFQGLGKIYITQVTLWNGGNLGFEPQTQRTPVVLSGNSNVKILDLKILNSKSIIEDNFSVNKLGDGKYQISWKAFDPDDGLKLLVMHSDSPKSISIDGKFAPNYQISRYRPSSLILPGFLILSLAFCSIWGGIYYHILGPQLDRLPDISGGITRPVCGLSGIAVCMAFSFYLFYQVIALTGGIAPFASSFEGGGGVDADAR